MEDYYEAVDREDWDYTYDNLDSLTQRLFTKEEWEEKNRWLADSERRGLSFVSVKVNSITQGGLADVTVDRTFDDGSSLSRKTHFFQEDGSWKHRFTQEEKDIFMPGTALRGLRRGPVRSVHFRHDKRGAPSASCVGPHDVRRRRS